MLNVELLLEQLNELQIDNDDLMKENKFLESELKSCEDALVSLEDKFEKYKSQRKKTHCWICGQGEMIWGADFSYDDYGIDGDGFVASLSCPNCNTNAEFYHTIGGDEE